jgi:hypothetical protein
MATGRKLSSLGDDRRWLPAKMAIQRNLGELAQYAA